MDYDMVITTYGTLVSDYKNRDHGVLNKLH